MLSGIRKLFFYYYGGWRISFYFYGNNFFLTCLENIDLDESLFVIFFRGKNFLVYEKNNWFYYGAG